MTILLSRLLRETFAKSLSSTSKFRGMGGAHGDYTVKLVLDRNIATRWSSKTSPNQSLPSADRYEAISGAGPESDTSGRVGGLVLIGTLQERNIHHLSLLPQSKRRLWSWKFRGPRGHRGAQRPPPG